MSNDKYDVTPKGTKTYLGPLTVIRVVKNKPYKFFINEAYEVGDRNTVYYYNEYGETCKIPYITDSGVFGFRYVSRSFAFNKTDQARILGRWASQAARLLNSSRLPEVKL